MQENPLPRAQLRHLTRHFFGRFFDTEVFADPNDEMHHLFVQVLALLVTPGLLKTVVSITRYSALAWFPIANRDRAVLIDVHFFLCLSMILTGFITVFEWDALFPDQKDFHNLSPLPIEPKTLFFAKVIALSLFVVLFHIAINGIPTLLFPGVVLVASFRRGTAGFMIPPGEQLRYVIAHASSLFLSTLFVFTSFIAVRAALILICPLKLVRAVSRYTQLAMIVLLVCAIFSGGDAYRLIMENNGLIRLLPPFWFLGLYETLIGHHGFVIGSLAKTACGAVAVSGIVSVVTYTISYRSFMQKGFQSAGIASYPVSGLRKVWSRALHRILLRKPLERASFHFVAQTAFRRQEHLFYWGSFVAVGIAFIYSDLASITASYLSVSSRYLNMMLSFPLIASFFILVGLRFVFSVPADLSANWIFKIIDKRKLETSRGGIHKFMLCVVYIPLLMLFTPFYLMIWDVQAVASHVLYVSILSLILVEVLLLRFTKLPFTCSYLPGKTNIQLWLPVYVLVCYLYTYGTTVLELWVLEDVWKYAVFVIISGIVFFRLNRYRALFLKENSAIRFEEDPAVHLNILSIEG
jgi:hypothetical protein